MPFVKHQILSLPDDSQILWRYLDLPKFMSLIQRKALFFPWINKLKDDPWEGRPSKLNFDENRIVPVRTVNGKDNPIENRLLKEILGGSEKIEEHRKAYLKMSRIFFVNCWHMNDGESDSQWKIYGTSPFSMAIVSSFLDLSNSINDGNEIYGASVSYYDPQRDVTPDGNAFFLATCKRKAFIHEKEFRLVYCDHSLLHGSENPSGVFISVNLETMIKKVVVSPLAPEWFVEEVKTFMQAHGLRIDCVKSDLLEVW